MKLQEYMFMITGVAGTSPKKYKVEKVKLLSHHDDYVTVSSWNFGNIIDKKLSSLFETRKAANKYIREVLQQQKKK